MGYEYSLRFTAPTTEAVTAVVRQISGAQEVFEPSYGFNFEPCAAQNGWPEATVSPDVGGLIFCDYRGLRGRAILGELIAELTAEFGAVTIEEF